MATFSVITDSSDATETILAEQLVELLGEQRPQLTALSLAREHDFTAQGASNTQNIVRLLTVSARTYSTEGSELTADDMDFDEEALTDTTRYVRRNLSHRAKKSSSFDLPVEAQAQGVRAVLDASDVAGLTLAQSAIANHGSSSLTLGMDDFGSAAATFAALNPIEGPRFAVLHNFAARDLRTSIRQSGGTIHNDPELRALMGNLNGYLGVHEGWNIIESSNISETGSAKQNLMCSQGVLRHGVWDPIQMPAANHPEYLSSVHIVWMRDGWALATNGVASTGAHSSVLKLLTKNS